MGIKIFRQLILVVTLAGNLVACTPPIVLTGMKTEPVHPDKVQLYFTEAPDCEYEKVGYLSVKGGYYSQASLFRAMQREAAKVGATGVYVQEARQLDILEFIGTATAIRCSSGEMDTYSSSSSSS